MGKLRATVSIPPTVFDRAASQLIPFGEGWQMADNVTLDGRHFTVPGARIRR